MCPAGSSRHLPRERSPECLSREVSRHPQNSFLPTGHAPGQAPATSCRISSQIAFDSPPFKTTCNGLPRHHPPAAVFPLSPFKWFLLSSILCGGQSLSPASRVYLLPPGSNVWPVFSLRRQSDVVHLPKRHTCAPCSWHVAAQVSQQAVWPWLSNS